MLTVQEFKLNLKKKNPTRLKIWFPWSKETPLVGPANIITDDCASFRFIRLDGDPSLE